MELSKIGIIVDPDMESRLRLKQVTSAVAQFKRVTSFSSLREVQASIRQTGDRVDIFFISTRIDRAEANNFIQTAKDLLPTRDAACILVMSGASQANSTMVASLVQGSDGFLLEPFSVQALADITELAEKIKKERRAERNDLAIRLLIQEIMGQVDQLAVLRKNNLPTTLTMKILKEMSGVLTALEPELKTRYYEIAIELLINARPPSDLMANTYRGASRRIIERQAQKTLSKVQELMAA